MTEYVKWMPYTHGDQPPYWIKDMLASVDEDGEKVNADWAWLAWSTYYVPYEAVHGAPRPAMDELTAQDADLIDICPNCEAQANTIEELRAANERWVIAFKQAEERANERIEALQADNARLREKLELIALGMTIELDEEDGPIQVWMDAEELSAIARKALQETER